MKTKEPKRREKKRGKKKGKKRAEGRGLKENFPKRRER